MIKFSVDSTTNPTDHPVTDVSINCGSSGTCAARSGREWLGDVHPLFSSMLHINGSSTVSTVIPNLILADPVPHRTARISRSRFSYAFQVNPGQIIIRLHFNPSPYKAFKGLKDLFSVEANSFTLLSNFSASLTADDRRLKTFTKEFCLNIHENQLLDIVFSPETTHSLDTYAFVNGIEIVSVPMHLSFFKAGDIGVQVVGEKSLIYVENNDALEIIQRISIKHDLVPSLGDFNDLFPKRATQEEDKTKHDTWKIPVEVGFRYLIRIHFSKLGLKISGSGSLIFKILINEMTAHTNMDILKAKDDGIVLYRDYIVTMRGLKKDGKRDLLIRLESYDELLNGHGVVAGFEIIKLSNPDNSLASPNPLPPPHDSPSRAIQIPLSILGHRYATATLAIAILSLLNIVVHKLRESWEDSSIDEENKPSSRAARLCRHFSLSEIRLATRNFSDGLFIGRGGFGKVYKGLIDKGKTTVAIKRLNPDSKQGAHEFLTEIETLSEPRHKNLAPLIGYCSERGEMILVYEYMPCGTLSDHLYKLARHNGNSSSLTWKQRLNICIGAAQGLAYLHTEHRVIHRDVKASNILLNESFVAKVSDFGLAKHEDKNKSQSQELSTRVKGTNGYLDPHYFLTCKLSRKSDTYAFGVVLLEALCGRPAVDIKAVEDEQILTKWARYMISKGKVDRIVDSSLRGQISPNSLNTFVRVAERCLDDEPKNRPTMSQIVLQLDDALEQQYNNNQNFIVKEIATTSDHGIRPSTCNDQIEVSATAQPAMTTTDMQNLTLPPNEQTNSNVVSTEHTSTTNKSSRIFPFWNRAKASKRNEVSLSERTKIKLPKFDWNKIVAATNYFSNSNMVGRAGFGSLYKAVLPAGEVVAVKIIPNISKRGQKDFKKQIGLLPNLEHQNIVKVLGYCAHKEDKMLVHEFMENTSLDNILESQSYYLRWPQRFKIIMGIARGLVYLHQDSGLGVIFTALKSSNILLDSEMNPKISVFGTAMTMLELQSESISVTLANYSDMPPEYLLQGRISLKCDVYSFGMIVLELVSGRRRKNASYWELSMSLPQYAWKLWSEGKGLNLVDDSLKGAFVMDEAERCIQVGLLCRQEEPDDRPDMSRVLEMLEGDELLMEPQEPWPPAPTKY